MRRLLYKAKDEHTQNIIYTLFRITNSLLAAQAAQSREDRRSMMVASSSVSNWVAEKKKVNKKGDCVLQFLISFVRILSIKTDTKSVLKFCCNLCISASVSCTYVKWEIDEKKQLNYGINIIFWNVYNMFDIVVAIFIWNEPCIPVLF